MKKDDRISYYNNMSKVKQKYENDNLVKITRKMREHNNLTFGNG